MALLFNIMWQHCQQNVFFNERGIFSLHVHWVFNKF